MGANSIMYDGPVREGEFALAGVFVKADEFQAIEVVRATFAGLTLSTTSIEVRVFIRWTPMQWAHVNGNRLTAGLSRQELSRRKLPRIHYQRAPRSMAEEQRHPLVLAGRGPRRRRRSCTAEEGRN